MEAIPARNGSRGHGSRSVAKIHQYNMTSAGRTTAVSLESIAAAARAMDAVCQRSRAAEWLRSAIGMQNDRAALYRLQTMRQAAIASMRW